MAQLPGNTVTLTSPSPTCATSDEPPCHARPVDSHFSVPPPLEPGGAVLAAVWLSSTGLAVFWLRIKPISGRWETALCRLVFFVEFRGRGRLKHWDAGVGRGQPLLGCCKEWREKAPPFARPTGKAPGSSGVLILGSLLCPLGGRGTDSAWREDWGHWHALWRDRTTGHQRGRVMGQKLPALEGSTPAGWDPVFSCQD